MKQCGEGRRFPRELPAQSRLPQLCVQPHGLFILLHTPMHNSLTSQCWQKAAQEIVFICALHLPSAKSFWLRYQACLSERDLDKAPATTCMQKSTTPEPWEAGTPPRAGCIPTGSLCCSCQMAAGTSSRRHTGDRRLGQKDAGGIPGKLRWFQRRGRMETLPLCYLPFWESIPGKLLSYKKIQLWAGFKFYYFLFYLTNLY